MRAARLVLVALAVALVMSACGGGDDDDSSATSRCESEFQKAEKVPVNERRPGLLYDAAVACKDLHMWGEVAARHADVLDGKTPLEVITVICNNGGEPRLANSELCANV